MRIETIEYLRSLVSAEAHRPGSGANFHLLIGALRELDVLAERKRAHDARGEPATGAAYAITASLNKMHEAECWGSQERGFIYNTSCKSCRARLEKDREAQAFLERSMQQSICTVTGCDVCAKDAAP